MIYISSASKIDDAVIKTKQVLPKLIAAMPLHKLVIFSTDYSTQEFDEIYVLIDHMVPRCQNLQNNLIFIYKRQYYKCVKYMYYFNIPCCDMVNTTATYMSRV